MAKAKPQNAIEAAIYRATDETLTTDNWQYNLEVCDEISKDPEALSAPAIATIILRINQKDANVVLRGLSLAVAVAQNCGSRMQHQIALRAFIHDCLFRKLHDRKVHATIKRQIVALICQLSADFSSDPSLRPMKEAYDTVASQYSQFLPSPPHKAPSKPEKRLKSSLEQQEEDDDLKRAMALSLQEYEREKMVKEVSAVSEPAQLSQAPENAVAKAMEAAPTPTTENVASVSKVLALYDLISYEPDELSFRKGDVISVIESVYRDWWRGTLPNGQTGIFPLNYVTPMVNKCPQELEREKQIEEQILGQDSRAIDELLALLLRDFSSIDEDKVTRLYNQVSPLRPQLGKCIDKYNVRKEELMVLNSHLNTQLSQYHDLINKLISTGPRRTLQHMVGAPYPTALGNDSANRSLDAASSANSHPLDPQPTSLGFGNFQQRPPHEGNGPCRPQPAYPSQ